MWWTKLYPELLLLDGDAERKRLMGDAQRKMKHRGWYSAAVFVGVCVSIPVAQYFVRQVGGYLAPLPPWSLRILAAGLGGAVVGLAMQRLWYKPFRDQLRRELIARGIPVCLRCGYSLTGNVSGRCSECGGKV